MIFTETPLKGAFFIDLERREDPRGFFARSFCQHEFEDHGLKPVIAQANTSFNYKAGTMRGMHMQLPPAAETKLVRCIHGSIYDVIVDMRPDSPTYLQHFGIELNDANRTALYVPEMFAHGYLALTDGAEVLYMVGEFYTPGAERGYRYNDPAFNIKWPVEVTVISDKDANWPLIETAGRTN
ncbi:MAG: dTDP-4-dehydrorhamnose 3,5-epimerase [Anaerolineae bacterium]|nr:dTDP-4-dehydrorhamnose 3,5-epimerase [Anaerolineae bacterium]